MKLSIYLTSTTSRRAIALANPFSAKEFLNFQQHLYRMGYRPPKR